MFGFDREMDFLDTPFEGLPGLASDLTISFLLGF